MRKSMALVSIVALLPTGVFGQAPGEATPSPAASPIRRPIASAIAALRSSPPRDGQGRRVDGDAATGVTVGMGSPAASLAPQLAADQEPSRVSDWSRVQQLQPGTEITLTVTGAPAAKVRLLVASDDAVFVLRPGGPKLPDRVSRALLSVGGQWPAVFGGGVAYSLADGVRVADGGVFDGTRKLADLAQVVQRTPREDVSEIRVAGQRKGNKLMAAVGAGGGFLLGAYIGGALAFKDCGASCSDEKFLAGLSIIGLPIALGLLGYYGGGRTVGGMIYRAPPTAGDGLGESSGQEIRQSLPAPHRDPAAR